MDTNNKYWYYRVEKFLKKNYRYNVSRILYLLLNKTIYK